MLRRENTRDQGFESDGSCRVVEGVRGGPHEEGLQQHETPDCGFSGSLLLCKENVTESSRQLGSRSTLRGHWPSAWWASSGSAACGVGLHRSGARWAPALSRQGDGWKQGAAASHCAHGACTPQEQPSSHPRMASELSPALQRSHYLEKENWSYTLGVLPPDFS